MAAVAMILWHTRHRLGDRDLPTPSPPRNSTLLLGASIIAVALPTAFPCFAAIAAVVGSGRPASGQLVALVLCNVCFVLPLLAILATILVGGRRMDERLSRLREFVQRRWPGVRAGVLLVFGAVVVSFGVGGLL